MAAPFSQTTRAIREDSFFASLFLTVVLCALFAGWAIWLSSAEITLHEQSQSAYLRDARVVIAEFPPALLGSLRQDQSASIVVEGYPRAEYSALPARITRIRNRPGTSTVEVRLAVESPTSTRIPLQKGQTVVVEVETERITPAVLLVRTLFAPESQTLVP